jgi:hypothetical protein
LVASVLTLLFARAFSEWLIAPTREHRERGILREAWVGRRELAEIKRRFAARHDRFTVTTLDTQTNVLRSLHRPRSVQE